MVSTVKNFIIITLLIFLLCFSINISNADCHVTGKMRASINKDWFGVYGQIKSYTITSVIYKGNRHAVPKSFPYVDRKTKNRYDETVCIVDSRALKFTGIADGDYEEVYISPKEVSFLCECTD